MALVAAVVLGFGLRTHSTNAATPGSTQKRLLDCPDTDGSGKIRTGDITKVVTQYGVDSPSASYRFIDDLTADGFIRTNDITFVVLRYGQDCPMVDTQVAQATLWAIANAPATENAAALLMLGYVKAGPDVPGQGVHYVNGLGDGVFDPTAKPDGLVYQNGKLAAQLYVVTGDVVGFVGEDDVTNAGPCNDGVDNDGDTFIDGADSHCVLPASPSGPPPDDVNIDTFCHPAPCSWDGTEGWHLHYNLCTFHIGKPNVSFTITLNDAACAVANSNGCLPEGCGAYVYKPRIGWMGHLWNWLPNANVVPDEGGTMNGRFADCFPDVGDPPSNTTGWTAYNCPQ
jgi:hypothetical protein